MVKAIREGLNVLRYHTRTRIRPETNGHHSANVAALCLALEPECSKEVLVRAIMHDVPEAYTGDIPYPFKAESSKVKASLQQAEMVYIDQIGLPHPDITQSEEMLLKTADMLDLVLSCGEERAMGNTTLDEVIERGVNYLADMPCFPKYDRKIGEILNGG